MILQSKDLGEIYYSFNSSTGNLNTVKAADGVLKNFSKVKADFPDSVYEEGLLPNPAGLVDGNTTVPGQSTLPSAPITPLIPPSMFSDVWEYFSTYVVALE
jgi:hypothetical protein